MTLQGDCTCKACLCKSRDQCYRLGHACSRCNIECCPERLRDVRKRVFPRRKINPLPGYGMGTPYGDGY